MTALTLQTNHHRLQVCRKGAAKQLQSQIDHYKNYEKQFSQVSTVHRIAGDLTAGRIHHTSNLNPSRDR